MARVSVDDIAAYRDHGAVCLRGLFAAKWLELLAAGVAYAARRVAAHRGPRARARRPGGGRGVAAIRGLVLSPGALPGPRGVP